MTPDATTTARRPSTTDAATALEPPAVRRPGTGPAPPRRRAPARRRTLQQPRAAPSPRRPPPPGLVWVFVLATIGVLAPFLASSDPLLVKTKSGRLFSPLLRDLRPGDVILATMYVTALVLLAWRRFSLGRSVLILLAAGALSAIPAFLFWRAQPAPIYEKWRTAEAGGELAWVVRTIVPFSPNDRMNDERGIDKLQPPSKRHWFGRSIFGEDVLSRMMHAC